MYMYISVSQMGIHYVATNNRHMNLVDLLDYLADRTE